MKIFIVDHTFFASSYRCTTVRERCLHFVNELRPTIIVVTGMYASNDDIVQQFVVRLHDKSTFIISDKQVAEIEGIYIQVENDSCLVHNKVIKPQIGILTIVEIKNNECHVSNLVLDIFSDEKFAQYHGNLSDYDIFALSQILKK